MRCAHVALIALIALAAPIALAQEALDSKKKKGADTPAEAVTLLRSAWEAKDDAAIVARYAEPGATAVKRDLAVARHFEQAQAAIKKAAIEKLGWKDPPDQPDPSVLGLEMRHPTSVLLAGAEKPVTVSDVKIEGEKANARVRIETTDGDREQRFNFVQRSGDWKVVLSTVDGTVLDDAAIRLQTDLATVREKTAVELEALAKEVTAGNVPGQDALRKRIAIVLEKERTSLAKVQEDARKKDPARDDEGDDE